MRTRSPVGAHVQRRAAPGELVGHQAVAAQLGRPVRARPSTGPTRWRGPRRSRRWARRRAARSRRPNPASAGGGQEERLGPGGGDGGQVGLVGAHGLGRGERHEGEEAGLPAGHDARRATASCSGSGSGPGITGSAGKSSSMVSPAKEARSGPLRVWKVSGAGAVDDARSRAARGPRPGWRGRTGRSRRRARTSAGRTWSGRRVGVR